MGRQLLGVPIACTLPFLLVVLTTSPALGGTKHEVEWRTIGASVHTSIDLDEKGSPASFIVAEGDGSFGRASVQGMSEPVRVPIDRCPAGTAMEFHMVGGTMVRTFHDRLDQVFIETTSGLACISRDGSVTSTNEARIIGGTGRFAGASGTLTTTTLPETVSFPVWKGEFNNIVNVSRGTLVLQDEN